MLEAVWLPNYTLETFRASMETGNINQEYGKNHTSKPTVLKPVKGTKKAKLHTKNIIIACREMVTIKGDLNRDICRRTHIVSDR